MKRINLFLNSVEIQLKRVKNNKIIVLLNSQQWWFVGLLCPRTRMAVRSKYYKMVKVKDTFKELTMSAHGPAREKQIVKLELQLRS